MTALEQGAAVAESRFRRTAVLCGVAIALSLVAIGFSLAALSDALAGGWPTGRCQVHADEKSRAMPGFFEMA